MIHHLYPSENDIARISSTPGSDSFSSRFFDVELFEADVSGVSDSVSDRLGSDDMVMMG